MIIELTEKEVEYLKEALSENCYDVGVGNNIINKLNGPKTRFGTYLQQKRLELGMGQRELSKRCNISNSEISRLESGERKSPSMDTLTKLVEGLGVDKEELLNIFFKG
jgi:predicted transcriptional regulator